MRALTSSAPRSARRVEVGRRVGADGEVEERGAPGTQGQAQVRVEHGAAVGCGPATLTQQRLERVAVEVAVHHPVAMVIDQLEPVDQLLEPADQPLEPVVQRFGHHTQRLTRATSSSLASARRSASACRTAIHVSASVEPMASRTTWLAAKAARASGRLAGRREIPEDASAVSSHAGRVDRRLGGQPQFPFDPVRARRRSRRRRRGRGWRWRRRP